MKLVAAAKLRRAQDAIVAARPYAQALDRVIAEVSARAGAEAHPLLAGRDGKRAQIVLLTSDRGLAGSFNAQIVRRVESFVEEDLSHFSEVSLRVVGRKGSEYFRRRNANIRSTYPAPHGVGALDFARQVATAVIADFLADEVDRVYVVYNEFRSAISQRVEVRQILPVQPAAGEAGGADAFPGDFLYEPSREALLEHLVPLHVQNSLYRASLESIASEFGARMSAMDSATRNAGEMIEKLTLDYNRARQAAITKELLEIIAGAESLKG
jgi:F-type H+-transporting ATPase subunit gamma